jgi:hypothetical protein
MGGGDAYEKSPVEAAISGANRTNTSIGVEFHGRRITKTGGKYSPFSDLKTAIRNLRNPPAGSILD